MDKNEIILFTDGNIALEVPITPEKETVWLTQEQMSALFDTARSSIAYHINNIFKEGELDKSTSVEIFDKSKNAASRPPMYYNLDVIISVGYRVKSKRGIAFRKWANKVLKDYIVKGYAVNNIRIAESKPEEKEMMISVIMNCIKWIAITQSNLMIMFLLNRICCCKKDTHKVLCCVSFVDFIIM